MALCLSLLLPFPLPLLSLLELPTKATTWRVEYISEYTPASVGSHTKKLSSALFCLLILTIIIHDSLSL